MDGTCTFRIAGMRTHAPNKTPLGHAELRHRTQALGQRHRTILLLVDGHRPLSEVLALAHKAGAQTIHFEDLVRLGLVDVPSEAMAPEPVVTGPGALDVPAVTSIELAVQAEMPAQPAAAHVLPVGEAVEIVLSPDGAAHSPTAAVRFDAADDEAPAVARVAVPRPLQRSLAAALAVQPASALTPAPKPKVRAPRAVPAAKRPPVRAQTAYMPADAAEEHLLQQVRDLLVDTLRLDAPLFGARMRMRVRGAQSSSALIDLAWEIESHLSHTRRSRHELLSLQRARELLGLGNTLVADDSPPTVRDSELPLAS
jgi:hypothetical protein